MFGSVSTDIIVPLFVFTVSTYLASVVLVSVAYFDPTNPVVYVVVSVVLFLSITLPESYSIVDSPLSNRFTVMNAIGISKNNNIGIRLPSILFITLLK